MPASKCNLRSPQCPLTQQPIPPHMHPHSRAWHHSPLRGTTTTTTSATPTPRSNVPETQQQQVGTKGVAQTESASTECAAMFAAPQPLATWGPPRRMQAAQSAPSPRTGCGPPPRLVRCAPPNGRHTGCGTKFSAPPLQAQGDDFPPRPPGRPRRASRRPCNNAKCTKIPSFWL